MADITLSYKGATISEISASGTKTLKTGGKYCEDDITLQYVKPSGTWNWMGKNPTLVSNYPLFTVALKDTDFNTWTPSTTQKVILASADWGTFTADMANYNYVLRWTFYTELAYITGAVLKNVPIKQVCVKYQSINRRYSNLANAIAQNLTANSYSNLFIAPTIAYYTAAGAVSFASAESYGFSETMAAPSISSTSADDPTVTLKRPSLNARCDTGTYMSTTGAAQIDKANSTLNIKCEVFRVDRPSPIEAEYLDIGLMYGE